LFIFVLTIRCSELPDGEDYNDETAEVENPNPVTAVLTGGVKRKADELKKPPTNRAMFCGMKQLI
jgi:hypothetical protein